jgi:hypothetical protein
MQLNPHAFNAHLAHMGQKVLWRRASVCPCKNPHSGASDPKCPHCGGVGHMWADVVESVAGITGSKTQREWAQFGMYETGDTVVSIPENSPLYDMGQGDRVTMLNATERFSIALVRGSPKERLIGKVETVDRVFWLDGDKSIVEGDLPKVLDGGGIEWGGASPPAETQYTISGTRFLEYFAWGAYPSNRNMHQGARLPKRIVLRSFDLWGRGEAKRTGQ